MDLIEQVRVVINEKDGDKAIQRETIIDKGKVEENQIRRIYNFHKKLDTAKDEIMKTQLAQKTLVTQPIDDSYMQQMLEVERLKMELARENIDVPTKTLISGIVFPNRF